jgi:hypothetical protein
MKALPFDSFSTNADNTNTTKVQVQKLSATKEDFLKSALQQVQMANEIGSQACSEIVLQGGESLVQAKRILVPYGCIYSYA